MKNFMVLFREPDGRLGAHSTEETAEHQQRWKKWLAKYSVEGKLAGGSSLTLSGKMIMNDGRVVDDIHRVGAEIVGGYLLLRADNLDEAVEIAGSCPVFEFGGYAEVREMTQ